VRTTARSLLAHDSHAGLVGNAEVSLASAAAAGDGLYALDFVAGSVVKDGVGQEDQSVRAGVGVMVLSGFPWTEYIRRFGVHSLSSFLWAGLRGVQPPAGPSLVCTSYILL
jgi:hypothetical protein